MNISSEDRLGIELSRILDHNIEDSHRACLFGEEAVDELDVEIRSVLCDQLFWRIDRILYAVLRWP